MSWADLKPENRRLAKQVLTHRQLRVLQHRLDGHSWNTIAQAMCMSKATARGHYRTALEKLERHIKEAA